MSVLGKLKDAVGVGGAHRDPTDAFRCTDCGEEFESGKDPRRASCPDCLSNDVERVGT